MALKKILIVPALRITTYSQRRLNQYKLAVQCALKREWGSARAVLKDHLLCTEPQHYGDIPKILGREQTFVVGTYYHDYRRFDIPEFSRYPSLHKTPDARFIRVPEIASVIPQVDAVLVSIRCGALRDQVIAQARKHNKLVAILDYFDHVSAYADNRLDDLTYGLKRGRDFDLFFKHDLPLGCRRDDLWPLAPMPVREENFPVSDRPMKERDIPVFFSGQNRPGILRADRAQMGDWVKKEIYQSAVAAPFKSQNRSLKAYWDILSRSQVALTPSGKVWDSTRHAEVAMFGCVPLIPMPDCETVTSLVRDNENAIAYRTRRLPDGTYTVVDAPEVMARLKALLKNPGQLEALGRAWSQEIRAHHTTYQRAAYIVQTINAFL